MTTRTPMTVLQVQRTVEAFTVTAATSTDYEMLHGEEDNLWRSVLNAIASGELTGDDAREAARLAVTTTALDFVRWYA